MNADSQNRLLISFVLLLIFSCIIIISTAFTYYKNQEIKQVLNDSKYLDLPTDYIYSDKEIQIIANLKDIINNSTAYIFNNCFSLIVNFITLIPLLFINKAVNFISKQFDTDVYIEDKKLNTINLTRFILFFIMFLFFIKNIFDSIDNINSISFISTQYKNLSNIILELKDSLNDNPTFF